MKTLKFIYEFFRILGSQDDFLYPLNENDKHQYPYSKKHWYKTRFGFKKSWDIAKIIIWG